MIDKTENYIHPELKEEEIFFLNCNQENFNNLEFTTKRIGIITYDGKGNTIKHENWFPVFVQEEEVLSLGTSLVEIRRRQVAEWQQKN